MKNKKDISDLIRDNQHKLDERPSERNWERLENKLDHRRSKGNSFLYRKIAMAAAVIALVAVISLITVVSDKPNSSMAKAETTAQFENWVIQDLETVYTDANTNVRLVVDFQKQLEKHYANPIQEGTPSKKLLASNNTFTGSVNRPEGLAKEVLAMKENKKIDVKKSAPQEENLSHILEAEDYPVEEVQVNLEPKNKNINNTNSASAKKKSNKKPEDSISKWLTTTQQMEWILGEWKEGNSIHEIQKVNKSTILCEDFILKDKRNSGLHFIDSGSQQSYALVSDEGDKKVFSNKNSDRIILENINPKKFIITFLPTSGVKKSRIFTR